MHICIMSDWLIAGEKSIGFIVIIIANGLLCML